MATITIAEAQAKLDARAAALTAEAREITRAVRAQTRNLDLGSEWLQDVLNVLDVRAVTPELSRRIAAYNAEVIRYRARRDEIKAARQTAANRRANAAEHANAVANACGRCFTAHAGEC